MPAGVPIPTLFLERMSNLLGKEYPAFAAALEDQPVSGLRVNTLKLTPEEFRRISPFLLAEAVPWAPCAFVLPPSDSSPGLHPYHPAGLYYLQDPSAMSAAALLEPQPGERVLDLAAAPGGKTTHLAALMRGRGLLVANEIKTKRLNHLLVNVERWGAANVVVINETPERLADHFGTFFDRVLVDAPCSGEGMFRKDTGARQDWSPEMVTGCAARQNSILQVAAKLVRAGGYLLYSTCTFAPEENEAVIAWLLSNCPGYEVVPIPLFAGFMAGRPDWLNKAAQNDRRRRHKEADSALYESLKNAVRLFPHRLRGEGHFACLLKRTDLLQDEARPGPLFDQHTGRLTRRTIGLWNRFAGETLSVSFSEERLRLVGDRLYLTPEGIPDMKGLRVSAPGIWLGNIKKDRFEPAHPLALYLRKGQAQNVLDLPANSQEIAAYLRGESIPSDGPAGWTLVTVDGFSLGWGKRVQGVVKNHYPRGWQVNS